MNTFNDIVINDPDFLKAKKDKEKEQRDRDKFFKQRKDILERGRPSPELKPKGSPPTLRPDKDAIRKERELLEAKNRKADKDFHKKKLEVGEKYKDQYPKEFEKWKKKEILKEKLREENFHKRQNERDMGMNREKER